MNQPEHGQSQMVQGGLNPQMLDSKMSILNDKSSEGMILWQNDRTDHLEIEVISPTDPTVRPYYTNIINKQISIPYLYRDFLIGRVL